MRSRRFWLVLAALLVPTTVAADDHRADLFGGGSLAFASNLWGAHGSFAVTLPSRNVSVVLIDFSGHRGSHGENDDDITQFTFMGGVRYTYTWQKDHQKFLPFVQVLAGGIHRGNGNGDTDPALGFGAGWEYVPERTGWGFRVQGDYVVHSGNITPRLSAGVLWRW